MLSIQVLGLFAARHFAVGHFSARIFRRYDISSLDISPPDILVQGYFATRMFRRRFLFQLVISLFEPINICLWYNFFVPPSFCCSPRYFHCLIHLKHRFFFQDFYLQGEAVKNSILSNLHVFNLLEWIIFLINGAHD